jgi:tetratricopeptide (TPR) repeat protein
MAGCGIARDMRAEYVANRKIADAMTELATSSPSNARIRADLDLAFQLAGHDPSVAGRLGGLYFGLEDYGQALRCYETAARVNPTQYEHEIAACRLVLGKDPPAAVLALEARADAERRAHRMSARAYAGMLNNLGYPMAIAGVRVEDALAMTREAVRIAPLEPAFIDSLGWAYYRLERYQEAAFHLERAVRLSPQVSAEMLWHLGAAHARLGMVARAASELRRALKLDPTRVEAEQALRRLERTLPPPARA